MHTAKHECHRVGLQKNSQGLHVVYLYIQQLLGSRRRHKNMLVLILTQKQDLKSSSTKSDTLLSTLVLHSCKSQNFKVAWKSMKTTDTACSVHVGHTMCGQL